MPKKIVMYIVIYTIFFALCTPSVIAGVLRVGTVNLLPYQMTINDEFRGSVVDLLECALNLTYTGFDMVIYPWEKSVRYFKNGKIDLLFSFEHNTHLDAFSSQTMPLLLENWYWLSNKGVDIQKRDLPIWAVLASNQAVWLKQQGYHNIQGVSSHEEALIMLRFGQIETLLIDENTVQKIAKKFNFNLRDEFKINYHFSKFTAYVSDTYLAKYPAFLNELNENIVECGPIGLTLDKHSRSVLSKFAEQLSFLTKDKKLIENLLKQNKFVLNNNDILYQDNEWRIQRKRQNRPFISRLIKCDLSKKLLALTHQYKDLFKEIFVVDKRGLIVGLSHVSSDFWQGDEHKFLKVFNNKTQSTYIGDIRYDESTHSFISHISLAIKDPKTGDDIGVFVFGVNVESVLQENEI